MSNGILSLWSQLSGREHASRTISGEQVFMDDTFYGFGVYNHDITEPCYFGEYDTFLFDEHDSNGIRDTMNGYQNISSVFKIYM